MKKILQIISVFLLSCLAVVLFGIVNQQKAHAATFNNDWLCKWEDDSHIHCSYNSQGSKAASDLIDALGSGVFGAGGWISSKLLSDVASGVDATGRITQEYWYDAARSKAVGVPVFSSNGSPLPEIQFGDIKHPELGLLMTDQNGNTSGSNLGNTTKGDNGPVVLVGNPQAAVNNKKSDVCSVSNSDNCKYAEDVPGHKKGEEYKGGGLSAETVKTFNESLVSAAAAEEAAKNGGACVDSPLSFFLCPVRDFLVSTFGSTIDVMVKLLQNPTVSKDAGVGKALASFTTLANSFYVLIFLFIILANFVNIPGLDNYTIKKLLPKLIAAIILTQFSFVICGAVLDIANIAAVTLPKYILQAFNITGTPGEAFANAVLPLSCLKTGSCASNVLTAGKELGQFMLLQITLIVGIVVALISLVYIVFRYLFLAILIIFAPLAFAAWVLPNTEKYFKEWWKYFIKLSIMFLLVNLLLVFGAVFSKIFDPAANGLGGSGFDQFIATLIDVVIPLVILFLIPKTLKISGDIMTSTGKLVGGAVAGSTAGKAGISAVKKSNQEGKLAEIRGGAQEKFGKKIGNVGMEARGKVLARQKANKEKEAVSQLGLSRQIELANGGNATARSAINSKLSDLSNKRVLTGQEYHDLYRLQRNAIDPNDPQYQAKITALDAQFADMNQLQYDPNDSNKVISYNTLSNPLYASTGTNTPTGTPTPAGGGGAGAGAGAAPGGGGGGRPAPAAAPGGTGTSGTATPGTGAGPGQARSSAAQFNRGARAGRAATGSSAAPLSNPNATPPPNPAGGPPGGGGTPPTPPAGPPPGFPGP